MIQVVYKSENPCFICGYTLDKNKPLSMEQKDFDKFKSNPYVKNLIERNVIKVFGENIEDMVKQVQQEIKETKVETKEPKEEIVEEVKEEVEVKETPKKKKGKK